MVGVIDTSTELLRLAGKDIDWLFVHAWGNPMVVVAKDVVLLGLRDEGIKTGGSTAIVTEPEINVLGDDAEGWYSSQTYPTTNDPGADNFGDVLAAAKRYHGWDQEDIASTYFSGWRYTAISLEAIKLAIERGGFENLNRRAVRDAMVSIKDFDIGWGYPPETITEARPYFGQFAKVHVVQGGEMRSVSDWISYYDYFEVER